MTTTTNTPSYAVQPPLSREGMDTVAGCQAYRIPDFDRLPPFLVSLLSETDTWCFVSSRGGLTAGRVEPAYCLFPYITDNELHLAHEHTGPLTLVRVNRDGQTSLWSPLREPASADRVRCLSKTVLGDRLITEELHLGHHLLYRSQLAPTSRLGLIRTITLENTSQNDTVELEILDGYRGLIPANIELNTLSRASCLIDAYTQAEVDHVTGLATVSLTATIVDSTEPTEALYANTVWSTGLPTDAVTLDANAVQAFEQGQQPAPSHLLQGHRAAYLTHARLRLEPGESHTWHTVIDARQTQRRIVELQQMLRQPNRAEQTIAEALDATATALVRNVENSDAAQTTGDPVSSAHHRTNVLFNNARGGVPASQYLAPASDILNFVETRNHPAAEVFGKLLDPQQQIDTLGAAG
jgi:hypothetical protein